jgi:hypothetical protein
MMDLNNILKYCRPSVCEEDFVAENMQRHMPTNCYCSIESHSKPVEQGGLKDFLDKNGFAIVWGLYDEDLLKEEPPKNLSGIINYNKNSEEFFHTENEMQVPGSLARYHYPRYRSAHTKIRIKLEQLLQEKLYNTYFYDRFYFEGQELTPHTDRDACEISFTFQISNNRDRVWPLWFRTPDGKDRFVCLPNGGGIIYKGCEILHWRNPLESKYNKYQKLFRKLMRKPDDTYHHQVFFHYVRANGSRVHCINDSHL